MAGKKKSNSNGANVGYEAELRRMADALRGSMDAGPRPDSAEYAWWRSHFSG